MADKSFDTLPSPTSSASLSSFQPSQPSTSKGTNVPAEASTKGGRKQSHGGARGGPDASATKVFVRVRPLNDRERRLQERGHPTTSIVHVDDENPAYITTLDPQKAFAPRETYVFERCFDSTSAHSKTLEEANEALLTQADMEACGRDQCEVYQYVGHPVLDNAVKGYNGCVFAYGQTGSGKTFTMMGPPDWAGFIAQATHPNAANDTTPSTGFSLDFSALATRAAAAGRSSSPVPTPRTPRGARRATRSRAGTILSVASDNVSVGRGDTLDLSSEAPQDDPSYGVEGIVPRLAVELFRALNRTRLDDSSHSFRVEMEYFEIYNEKVMDLLRVSGNAELRIRNSASGPYVENLTRKTVLHANDVFKLLHKGNAERHTASTKMNDRSSRSHAILTLHIVQVKLSEDDTSSRMSSKINLVDLAGSERTGASGVAGQQFKEATKINLSLTTLGRVIDALADMSQGKHGIFCPFRDSNLTWLLMDSLGGNSKTTMVATVSPHPVSFEETCQTLRYASRAKQIVTRATINEDPQARQIRLLQAEVQRLQGLVNGDDDGRDDYVDELKERLSMLQAELDAKTAELDHTYEELAALRSLRAAGASSTSSSGFVGAGGVGGANAKELMRLRDEVSRLEGENLLLTNTERELHDAKEQVRKAEAKANQLSLVLRGSEKKASDAQTAVRRLEKENRDVTKLKERLKKLTQEHAESLERENQLREAMRGLEVSRHTSSSVDENNERDAAASGSTRRGGDTITERLNRMQSLGGSAPFSTQPVVVSRRRSSAGADLSVNVAVAEKAATEWKLRFEQEQALHSANRQKLKEKQIALREMEAQLKASHDEVANARRLSDFHESTAEELDKTQSMLVEAELALGRAHFEAEAARKAQREMQRAHAAQLATLEKEKQAAQSERDHMRDERDAAVAANKADQDAATSVQAMLKLHTYEQRTMREWQAHAMLAASKADTDKQDVLIAAIEAVMLSGASATVKQRHADMTQRHNSALEALQRCAEQDQAAQEKEHHQALLDVQAQMNAMRRDYDETQRNLVQNHEAAAAKRDAEFQSERQALQAQLDAAQTALDDTRAALEATVQQHAAQVSSLTQDGDAARGEASAQRDALVAAEARLGEASAALQAATARGEALTEQIAALEASRAELQAQVVALGDEKEAAQAEQSKTSQAVTTLTEEVAGLRGQVTSLETALADLRDTHEREIQDANAAHDAALQATREAHVAAVAQADAANAATCKALHEQLSHAQQELEKTRAGLTEANAERVARIEALEAKLAESAEQLKQARFVNAATEDEKASLQMALETARDANEKLTAELDAQKNACQDVQNEHVAAQLQAHELASSLAETQAEVQNLTEQLQATTAQLGTTERDAAATTHALEEAEAALDALQTTLDATRASRDELESKLAAARDEGNSQVEAIERLTAQLATAESARLDTEAARKTGEEAHARVQAEMMNELQALRATIEDERGQLESAAVERRAVEEAAQTELSKLQRTRAKQEAALSEKEDANTALAQQLKDTESQRDAAEEALKTAHARVRDTETSKDSLRVALEEAEEAKAALAQRLQALLAQQEQAQEEVAQRESSLRTALDVAQDSATRAEGELQRVNAELQQTREVMAQNERTREAEVSALKADMNAIREQLRESNQASEEAATRFTEEQESMRRSSEVQLAALQTQLANTEQQCQNVQAEMVQLQGKLAALITSRDEAEAEAEALKEALRASEASLSAANDDAVRTREALEALAADSEAASAKLQALERLQKQTVADAAKQLEEELAKTERKYTELLRARDDTIAQLSEDLEFRANLDLCDADAAASAANRSFAGPSATTSKSAGLGGLFSLLGRRTAGGATGSPSAAAQPNDGKEMSSELTRRSSSFDPVSTFRAKPSPFS